MHHSQWKKIGKIGKPFGLGGAFYVGGRPNLMPNVYPEMIVGSDPSTAEPSRVTAYQVHRERAVVRLAAYADRTAIDAVIGATLWASASIGEHPYSGLIGRQVIASDGELLGHVVEFYNHGASDNVEIENSAGEFLEIPFVESYVVWDFASAPALPAAIQSGSEPPLRLQVPASTFADLWSPHRA